MLKFFDGFYKFMIRGLRFAFKVTQFPSFSFESKAQYLYRAIQRFQNKLI